MNSDTESNEALARREHLLTAEVRSPRLRTDWPADITLSGELVRYTVQDAWATDYSRSKPSTKTNESTTERRT